MGVKVQPGDIIAIPKDCKTIIKDGNVIFEKEEKNFKDGDILAYANYSGYSYPFIYKNTDERGFHKFYVGINSVKEVCLPHDSKLLWGNAALRHANYDERRFLFNKMYEQGLKWNAEEKRVETIRWRALTHHEYYYVNAKGNISTDEEESHIFDIKKYEFGNYFHTKEQAEEAAKRVKEVLLKYHEELGE